MKLKNLLFAIFLVCGVSANAQFNFGIKAGLNVSEISGYDLDSKAGFHAGAIFQYMFSEQIGIESGLYYSLQGGRNTEYDRNEDYEMEADPSYLQMPILFLYKFGLKNDLKLYPAAGLYLGYGLGGSFESKGVDYGVDISGKGDFFTDTRNNFDMGLSLGLNLSYKKMLFGVGYEQGFLKINKERIPFEDDDAFNSNFKVSLGYLF